MTTQTTKFQPMPKPPKGVQLVGLTLEYYQEADSDDPDDGYQALIVKTADAGGGTYPVISTERWAMDAEDTQWLADVCRWACELAPGWSTAVKEGEKE